MIRILTLHLLLVAATFTFAQQVPNGDFESWIGNTPSSWHTTNMSILGIPFVTVVKDNTNPQHGLSSAQLKVITTYIPLQGNISMQGALSTAEMIIDPFAQTVTLQGGYPFTGMPNRLSGFFKYLPVGPDTCYMGWALSKWNNGVRDTIGFAYIDTAGTFSNWTYFEIPLEYTIWEEPDTMNILFLCSNPVDGLTHTGTKMWVDNLTFIYGPVSVEGVTFPEGIRIYADGTNRKLIIETSYDRESFMAMTLYTINGRKVAEERKWMGKNTETLDISQLPPGTYIFRLTTGNRQIVVRKITILR